MVNKQSSVLIIDDDEDILTAGKMLLSRHFSEVTCCNKPEDMISLMEGKLFDVVLLDMNFGPGESSGEQGLYWLGKLLAFDQLCVVIMFTAHESTQLVVEAMKQGATDFITKPWQNEKLVATVSAGVKLRKSRIEAAQLKKTNQLLASASAKADQKMLGQSPIMSNIMSLIKRVASSDANILVLGENGTGKELVARQLHQQSLRADQVFISVDMGALSETLFESELFGHKKGAFTGAHNDRIGRFHAAEGGTLFLDEVGNIPLHLQKKLLAVLESRHVTPLGCNTPKPFNVRIVSATNMTRENLNDEDSFRQDLLFRLNTVEIILPPLRERKEDIQVIAVYYASLYARKYAKPIKMFSAAALAAMQAYSWPGNIRALRHAVERAVVLSEGVSLEPIDLQLDGQLLSQLKVLASSQYGSQKETIKNANEIDDLNLASNEKTIIERALRKHRYNISDTAKELGLTRAALYRRMKKYGL